MSRLMLCSDLDRTLLPNGAQPESVLARRRFFAFAQHPDVTVIYVTGRHRELVEQAIINYRLPMPDYVIADVGTKIYRIENEKWSALSAWVQQIEGDWNGYSHAQLADMFGDIAELQLQEQSKQSLLKLSYYVELDVNHQALLESMAQRLQTAGVKASLVWSIDEPANIGLLDVLPQTATKVHAIEFLYEQLGYQRDEVIFAGDSGNDVPVLISPINSVLVANASKEVRELTVRESQARGTMDALYLANGSYLHMNGNYAAGVLEGIYHFAPDFRSLLAS